MHLNNNKQQYMKRKKKEQEHSGKLTPEKEPGGPFLLVLGNLLYPKPSPLISLFFFLVFFLSALCQTPLCNQPGDPSSLPSSEYPACSSRMSLQTLQKLTSL